MKEKDKITRHTINPVEPQKFLFLGIVTSEPDYRLSVALNMLFRISLQHSRKDIIDGSGEDAPHYSVFTTKPAILSLISNKTTGNFLIRKLKNIDFFLVIHGVPDRTKADTLAAGIRKSPNVTAVFVFDSNEIKDRNIGLLIQ